MKKILALVLAVLFVLSLAACGESADATKDQQSAASSDFKMGAVLVGDENEGYTFAHIDGIKKAAAELGVSEDQIIFKYTIPEDEKCYDACKDLAEQGCKLIITNSYGHQSYCQQAATEFPEIQFVSMTGDTAKASKLANFSNAFTNIYEARYVAGVVAGMKVKELADAGKITDANKKDGKVKLGYVGAYPYAEVVSGYTAYFLGVQSIYKDVVMEVQYTNSWFDITAEGEAANALLSDGCVIIAQHADSTGAPSAVQAALEGGKVCYSVGYNVDMLSVAPDAALTSATNNWAAYYKEAIGLALKGEKVPTNWAKGYADGAVAITELGKSCAAGTQEKVDETIAAIKAGTLHVFDTSKFTVGGKEVTSAFATDTDGDFTPDADEAVIDGYYHESDCELNQSAPSFGLRIDGITELNAG